MRISAKTKVNKQTWKFGYVPEHNQILIDSLVSSLSHYLVTLMSVDCDPTSNWILQLQMIIWAIILNHDE